MIVVDTSVILAILFDEPDAPSFEATIERNESWISAVNVHEALIVMRRRQGSKAADLPMVLIERMAIESVAFDEVQLRAATEGYRLYGKGIHSLARLNICDCAAYALAKTRGVRLLFKGDDFSHTDLMSAV